MEQKDSIAIQKLSQAAASQAKSPLSNRLHWYFRHQASKQPSYWRGCPPLYWPSESLSDL